MFDIDSLVNDIWMEMSMTASQFSQDVIDTLVKQYVIPSFNRDYPHVMTVIIKDKSRFYPYTDLSGSIGTNYLSHIFLIKQDRGMWSWIQSQLGHGEADNFVTVASSDIVKKIVRLSYKNDSFVHSPIILYDDTVNDYYYSLDVNSRYVLIFSLLNSLTGDSTAIIHPQDYEALKWYASWKISDFLITGMDMSTIGILNQYLDKVMQGISSTDATKLFNPTVSSLSFGGEISIGFSTQGSVTQTVQSAIPMVRNAYKDVQDSLRKFGIASFKRYKNLMMKKFMWLYMV